MGDTAELQSVAGAAGGEVDEYAGDRQAGPQAALTPTREALTELADVLDASGEELHALARRSRNLHDELDGARPLAAVMAQEERPLIVTTMTRLIHRLTAASLKVRRAEARQLQREGLSHERIAELFEVSRQRVAVLLQTPAAVSDAPHEGRQAVRRGGRGAHTEEGRS